MLKILKNIEVKYLLFHDANIEKELIIFMNQLLN